MQGPLKYGRQLYTIVKDFFSATFPDYGWRAKFAAFNNDEHQLPAAVRLQYRDEIAVKAGENASEARAQMQSIMVHLPRLWQEHRSNKKVWIAILELCRNAKTHAFRSDRRALVQVCLDFVGLLDTTSEIERTISRLNALDAKSRERHFGIFALGDALKVAHVWKHVNSVFVKCVYNKVCPTGVA